MQELIKKRLELETRKRELDNDLDLAKSQIRSIDEQLRDRMLEAGTQSVNQGGFCVYLKSQLWASASDIEQAAEALTESGFPELVKQSINANSLSALIREFAKNEAGEPVLPASMAFAVDSGAIKITQDTVIGVRKS